jgi:hypothetical protein
MTDRDQTGRRPRVVIEGDVERAAKHRRAATSNPAPDVEIDPDDCPV